MQNSLPEVGQHHPWQLAPVVLHPGGTELEGPGDLIRQVLSRVAAHVEMHPIEDFVELSLHGMAATTEPPAQP